MMAKGITEPPWLQYFVENISKKRGLEANIVSFGQLKNYLSFFPGFKVSERVYHLDGQKYLRTTENFNDKHVNPLYLIKRSKAFAKYHVFHPDLSFILEVYKSIYDWSDEDKSLRIITTSKGQKLPEGLQ